MKKILFLLILSTSIFSFGQKIKEDDDQILFDNVAVAKVEKDKAGTQFKYTSINNANAIIATLKTHKIDAQNSKSWLVVTNLDGTKTTEVDFALMSFTLNYKKAVAEILAKKYNILTTNGVENLDAFFAEERPSISAEIEKLKESAKGLEKDLATMNYQVFCKDKLIFSGVVPADAFTDKYSKEQNKEFMSKVVAKYDVSMKQNNSPYPVLNVEIASLSGRVLVQAVETGGKMVVALVESDKTFTYVPTAKINNADLASSESFVKELVDITYLNGQKYMTLMEAEVLLEARQADKMAKLDAAKLNSSNIYDKKGYVIDQKGEKLEGTLSIDFEKIAIANSSNGMVDLDGVGKLLKVLAKNEKGDLRYYSYKAKENVLFSIVNDDKSETKYRALLVKVEEVAAPKDNSALDLGAMAGISLATASWKYFKEVQITDKMSIYQDIPSNSYVIKIPSQEKGFQILIKKGKEEKFFTKLKEYIGGSVSSSDIEKIDYSNVNGLKDLVDLYSKSI